MIQSRFKLNRDLDVPITGVDVILCSLSFQLWHICIFIYFTQIFVAYFLCRFWSMLLLDAVPLLEADTVCSTSVSNY